MAKLEPMNPTVNYEEAWKELRGMLGLMNARSLHKTILLQMDEFEKKYKNVITIKRRTDNEMVDYCIKKSVEAQMENIHLRKRIKELKEDKEKIFDVYVMVESKEYGYTYCIKKLMSYKEYSVYDNAFRNGETINHKGEKVRVIEINISYPARG